MVAEDIAKECWDPQATSGGDHKCPFCAKRFPAQWALQVHVYERTCRNDPALFVLSDKVLTHVSFDAEKLEPIFKIIKNGTSLHELVCNLCSPGKVRVCEEESVSQAPGKGFVDIALYLGPACYRRRF